MLKMQSTFVTNILMTFMNFGYRIEAQTNVDDSNESEIRFNAMQFKVELHLKLFRESFKQFEFYFFYLLQFRRSRIFHFY